MYIYVNIYVITYIGPRVEGSGALGCGQVSRSLANTAAPPSGSGSLTLTPGVRVPHPNPGGQGPSPSPQGLGSLTLTPAGHTAQGSKPLPGPAARVPRPNP